MFKDSQSNTAYAYGFIIYSKIANAKLKLRMTQNS